MKQAEPRYMIGSITTKDHQLWLRVRQLQSHGETMESIIKAGVEFLEQNSIDGMAQNNNS